MNIATLTPQSLRRAADVKEQIETLQDELAKLLPTGTDHGNGLQPLPTSKRKAPAGARAKAKKIHWTQTPAGRATMAKSMKRRWKRGEF